MKLFYVFISLIFSCSLFGQVSIHVQNQTPLRLSDIAEKQLEIHFSGPQFGLQYVYISGQNVYMADMRKIYIFTLSGKHIKTIESGGFVEGLAGDEWKHELYVPVSDKEQNFLKCYDETGRLLRQHPLAQPISASVYFENRLWLQGFSIKNDTVCYSLSNVDCMTGEITDLGTFHFDYYRPGFAIGSPAVFSIRDGILFFSVNTDSTLYQVRGNRFEPYLRWNIIPAAKDWIERGILNSHFVAGRYLFVNYQRQSEREDMVGYLYVKAIKGVSEEYNVRYEGNFENRLAGILDDLYGTGYVKVAPTNKQNYLCFWKQKDEQSGKKERILYIVRAKR